MSASTQMGDRQRTGAAWIIGAGLLLTLAVVGVMQLLHGGSHETVELPPLLHWLRDSAMALPAVTLAVAIAALPRARRVADAWLPHSVMAPAWALVVSAGIAAGLVPGNVVHQWLFVSADHEHAMGTVEHVARDAASGMIVALGVALVIAAFGTSWTPPSAAVAEMLPTRAAVLRAGARVTVAAGTGALVVAGLAAPAQSQDVVTQSVPDGPQCTDDNTVLANVVALDQPFDYNRLGATNPAGMVFALRHDVVLKTAIGINAAGTPLSQVEGLSGDQLAGNVSLRQDKRPRPLTLRMTVGQCIEIAFQNLLGTQRADSEQPADRNVGVHVKGLAVVNGLQDDGTFVGANESSLAAPGEEKTYLLYGEHENGYVFDNGAALAAGEAGGGTTAFGLFGAVNVEPESTQGFRSQLTRVEMDLAASAWNADGSPSVGNEPRYGDDGLPLVQLTNDGQPVLNYEAVYPTDDQAFGYDPARAGQPILRIHNDAGVVVHGDLNAVIAGPRGNDWKIPEGSYPAGYWDNQIINENERRGEEPFREFTVIFHDEIFALQAFDHFDDPDFEHTLHSVRDGFAVNYGTAGVGAEVIANRLQVGPMGDCIECKYEEFFLTSWAVGDPAMVVNIPANQVAAAAENGQPLPDNVHVKYPDDPSNVHHSYLNDRTKFRNLHAGPAEHHIFHLHAHQWQQTPNEPNSSYLDSQLIGPGAAFTYDIAYGGSGNRNKTVGDSIFHCHFYPHFAQGMWELWRVHDTFERGTVMDGVLPAATARALPDGEIDAGTPIPAVVPVPSMPMAPMPFAPDPDGDGPEEPTESTLVAVDLDGDGPGQTSAQVDLDADGTADVLEDGFSAVDVPETANPGYPFYIAAAAGHRPPTPPLDMADFNGDGEVTRGESDGGIRRHIILGGTATSFVTPKDMNKIIDSAYVAYLPEDGTPAEKAAMAFHADPWHETVLPDGTSPGATRPGFETNGLPAQKGAPYADPCRSDTTSQTGIAPAGNPRDYKAAVIQFDAVFNKAGWHFPQQRIEALWADASPTITGDRAPEPLVIRVNADDCVEFWHANLTPNVYELDDYQVRTPTDVIGQHIHLVKFDVTSADGSANGFNYEDGTFSPQEVEERIHAVREGTKAGGQPAFGVPPTECGNGGGDARQDAGEDAGTDECPLAVKHPYFGDQPGVGDLAWGARSLVQRWYADPLLNESWDAGHGSVFTHDHFGPSTHQQTGLYATVLVEPEGARWRDPETGAWMDEGRTVFTQSNGTEVTDGGPTSWRADILMDGPNAQYSHREFYLEFGDFEHAYQAGGGALHEEDNGAGVMIPSYADAQNVINPSVRVAADNTPDLMLHPAVCPNGDPRPCPEGISADDIGTMLVNYRNEPIGHRIFNPGTLSDPTVPPQAAGAAGDLALAFSSDVDRAMDALDTQPGVYGTRPGVKPGDPFTPLLRAYAGDNIRIRMQVGATEEQHNFSIDGMKWLDEPLSPNSGWRNGKASGISEYFILEAPVLPNAGKGSPAELDYMWTTGAAVDDYWNGTWGLLRSYQKSRNDLVPLPINEIPRRGWEIANPGDFDATGTCPVDAPVQKFRVSAIRVADVTGDPDGLVYNSRSQTVTAPDGTPQGSGPLVDPNALVYMLDEDLDITKGKGKNNPDIVNGLKPGVTIEPLVLRVNAGDCIQLELANRLPDVIPDSPGYNALPPIVHKKEGPGGVLTFNTNDITPSSTVGLHPQLLHYDVRTSNGLDVGGNSIKSPTPGTKKQYTWFAGDVTSEELNGQQKLTATPVEFGVVGLMPADRIEGSSKGLVGALVVEPELAQWTTDPGTRLSADVSVPGGPSFREHVVVLQDDLTLRYSDGCPGVPGDMDCAVPAVPSEGKGVPEDAEDSGQRAINYRTDPVWYRLGIAPDTPFEDPSSRDNTDVHRAFSNTLVGSDPESPIFTAQAGEPVRMRVVQPGGHARGHVIALNGHTWQRQPYVNGSTSLGESPSSWWIGAQEGVGPALHHDLLLPKAGGPFGRSGDYLLRDSASLGSYQGLWGLLRVQE